MAESVIAGLSPLVADLGADLSPLVADLEADLEAAVAGLGEDLEAAVADFVVGAADLAAVLTHLLTVRCRCTNVMTYPLGRYA